MTIVFLQLSPATSIGILIYLKYDKNEINLKLNKIKLIPHQGKRLLNKDISSACPHLTLFSVLFFSVLCRRGDLPSSPVTKENSVSQ